MKKLARKLRKDQTDAERQLWKHLRNRQINNFKFRRQEPIEKYIVDFVSVEAKVIVEVDGGQHAEQIQHDKERTNYLEQLGYRVLRFWNNEVTGNLQGVLEKIQEELIRSPHPNPLPPGEGNSISPLLPQGGED